MGETFAWRCPFCDRDTIINSDHSLRRAECRVTIPNHDGPRAALPMFVVCPNKECRRLAFRIALHELDPEMAIVRDSGGRSHKEYQSAWTLGAVIRGRSLIPPSHAKAFPAYVHQAVRNDYEEACAIRDVSPKAAATLARRALQGMIRGFWGVKVKSGKLFDEIDELKDKVEPEVWDAMDAVRKVGNIGAHMEQDVNLIIDVDPEEADKLIALIEMLIKEWYINRNNRQAA